MKNYTSLKNNPDDIAFVVERSAEFICIAKRISEHMKTLPITNDAHNELVKFMVAQINEAEKTSFMHGFGEGLNAKKTFNMARW